MPESPGANSADVIEWAGIVSICPAEAAALDALLRKHGLDTDVLAMALDGGPEIARGKLGKARRAVLAAWARLQAAFEANTSTEGAGLRLRCRFHQAERGSPHDEVGCCVFSLEGCYELSPAGEKFQALFRRRSCVRIAW